MGFWPDFGSYMLFDLGFHINLIENEAAALSVNRNRSEEILLPMVCVTCSGEPMSSSVLPTTKDGLVPLNDFICYVDDIIKAGEEEKL